MLWATPIRPCQKSCGPWQLWQPQYISVVPIDNNKQFYSFTHLIGTNSIKSCHLWHIMQNFYCYKYPTLNPYQDFKTKSEWHCHQSMCQWQWPIPIVCLYGSLHHPCQQPWHSPILATCWTWWCIWLQNVSWRNQQSHQKDETMLAINFQIDASHDTPPWCISPICC